MISVVIPTLNEAERLPRLLADLRAGGAAAEIIVADGGSADATPAVAREMGARVVHASRGRGHQIAAGAAKASGEFRIEDFVDACDMLRHMGGGALMGMGGIMALGCTIGQGLAGMSTLALGSLLALASIIAGGVFGVRYLEQGSFGAALRAMLARG